MGTVPRAKPVWTVPICYAILLFMRNKLIIKIIAYIELLLGISTFLGSVIYALLSVSQKSLSVFIFVIVSSIISIVIGLGLLIRRKWAKRILIFFSGYIIMTKIFIFAGLLQFTGEMINIVHVDLKNFISGMYHTAVILFLSRKTVRKEFE